MTSYFITGSIEFTCACSRFSECRSSETLLSPRRRRRLFARVDYEIVGEAISRLKANWNKYRSPIRCREEKTVEVIYCSTRWRELRHAKCSHVIVLHFSISLCSSLFFLFSRSEKPLLVRLVESTSPFLTLIWIKAINPHVPRRARERESRMFVDCLRNRSRTAWWTSFSLVVPTPAFCFASRWG